ncbi:MAG: caspase family protein [Planctomycetia bacterium]|nr:caspase family protein [Planctomycetia bacterium]
MNTRSLLLAISAIALFASEVSAQQFDRRSRDEPEIVVETGGRVGPCDVLRFTPDGRFLLAGGDDKVVRVWPHSASGLETEPARVKVLRWRAWREQRGGIKTLAISIDGKRVAVGGYGMKPATVAILNRESGELLALTWPKSRPGVDNFGSVMSVCFDADGRVGFGTADGSVWLWEPVKLKEPDANGRPSSLPVRVGKHETLRDPAGNTEFNFPRLVHFRDTHTLVSIAQSGQVLACDLTGKFSPEPGDPPTAKELFNVYDGQPFKDRVYRAELIDGGKWVLAASAAPLVLLRSIDGKSAIPLELPNDRFPRSIAFHPKTRQVAVGVGAALPAKQKLRFFAEGHDEIWLFEDPIKTGAKTKPNPFKHTGRAEALAFHPSENQLAIAGGDADEVTLVSLAKPDIPLTVVRGAGRRPWGVNISENGSVVGVRIGRDATALDPNLRGAGPWVRFDLDRLKPTLDEAQKWIDPLKEANGWTVVPDEKDRFVWYAERKREGVTLRLRLALDRHRDLAPTCFTFLPEKDGKPTRVLVGHYYGCTLFELVPGRAVKGAITGTKVFIGHAGEVTSVVAAKDQSWFVSGGTDHTVVAWALVDWQSEPGLGAKFAEKDGWVVVNAVDNGSPAWEAGLRVGDVIDLFFVDGKRIFDRRAGVKPLGTTDVVLEALKSPRPRIELYFGLAARGKIARRETLTTVRQRPLWKWFPAFNGENRLTDWVMWMWHGSYYHTKTAHGDRLVGWHVNSPEAGGRTEFYQLQQFEKQFHRPEVLEKLISTRNAGAALVTARGENPPLMSFTQYEPAPVRLALKRTEVKEDGLALTVHVQPRGSNVDLMPERIELWLNDYLLDSWPKAGEKLNPKVPFQAPVTIQANKFRAGENQLAVLTFNVAGGRAEDFQIVRNARPAREPNLLALLAGVNDYSDHRKNVVGARKFGDLKSAKNDATALGDLLLTYRGPKRFFLDGKVDVRLDADVARKKILADLDASALRAKPDDLLMVFFAGHGDLLMPKNEPVPKGGRGVLSSEGVFLFCCPNYSPLKPSETALSADELFSALAKINCRKIVLLDACHSGQATSANVLRRCVPNGQGPIVIAACDQSEVSYEHPRFGHGLFTFAVLDALGDGFRKADYNSDGELSPVELFDYIAGRVPVLMRQIGKKDETQTPICFPRRLPKDVLLKK